MLWGPHKACGVKTCRKTWMHSLCRWTPCSSAWLLPLMRTVQQECSSLCSSARIVAASCAFLHIWPCWSHSRLLCRFPISTFLLHHLQVNQLCTSHSVLSYRTVYYWVLWAIFSVHNLNVSAFVVSYNRTVLCDNVSALNHIFLILPGHLKTLEDRPICPSLEDFSFTRWTPEQVRLFWWLYKASTNHLVNKIF